MLRSSANSSAEMVARPDRRPDDHPPDWFGMMTSLGSPAKPPGQLRPRSAPRQAGICTPCRCWGPRGRSLVEQHDPARNQASNPSRARSWSWRFVHVRTAPTRPRSDIRTTSTHRRSSRSPRCGSPIRNRRRSAGWWPRPPDRAAAGPASPRSPATASSGRPPHPTRSQTARSAPPPRWQVELAHPR